MSWNFWKKNQKPKGEMKTMKIIKIATLTAALMLSAGAARAAHIWSEPGPWWSEHFTYVADTPKFTPQGLSLDLFGSYEAGGRKFNKLFETSIRGRRGGWGWGVGLNYFITREIGIGVDANAGDDRGPFVDHVLGSVIARWPFEPTGWAPYVFGGGGRATDPHYEWLGHFGVGVEYRFNPTTGMFMDGRYIWHEKEGSFDRSLLRAEIGRASCRERV